MRFRRVRKKPKEFDPYKRGIFEPKRYYELIRKAVTTTEAPSGSRRAQELSPSCLRNLHLLCGGLVDTSFGEEVPECRCLCHVDET